MLHLYKILEFSQPVEIDEIKARYRELAKRYHPDVCKHPGAEERFKLISNAYRELLNVVKPSIKKNARRPKPRRNVDQKIFRILDHKQKIKIYTIYYPDTIINKNTQFIFMYNSIEFSIVAETEYQLPTEIKAKVAKDSLTIKIVTG